MPNLNCRLVFPRKIIPNAPLGQDVLRLRWFLLQFFPQTADVDVHRAEFPDVLITPHQVQQALPAVHPPGILQKQLDEIELLGRQVDGVAVPAAPAGPRRGDGSLQPVRAAPAGEDCRPGAARPVPGPSAPEC